MVKGIKLKEKSKRKKNQESGSGHPWPGTDSGPGSGPLWPGFWFRVRTRIRVYGSRSGCLPESTDFLDYLRTFTDFFGLLRTRMVPEKICSGVRWNGGKLLLKIWIKTRKIVGSTALLFRLRSSFYTSRGGDRRPQFAVWRVGVSWQILHGTSFIK